ncbi:MAG: HEAT repeat domain-containing protein, partial [Ktedonobacterales bacterium]
MALGQIGDPRAVAPLVATLDGGGGNFRLTYAELDESGAVTGTFMTGGVVAKALGKLGEPGLQVLLTMLHDHADDEYVGQPVAYRLGELGDRRAIPALIAALRSDVYEVHASGAQALASFGNDALVVLLDILHAGSSTWGGSLQPLVYAFLRIGESAIEPLIELLHMSDDKDVRLVAVEALGDISARREPLEESLWAALRQGLRSVLGDTDADVRLEAALRLGNLGDASGLAILLEMLASADAIGARRAMYALENIGAEAVEPLLAVLADTSRTQQARVRAVEALTRIGDTRAIPGLLAALKDDDRQVRMAAEKALGELKAQDAIEPLREVLKEGGAEVGAEEQLNVLIALAQLGDTSVIPALLQEIASMDERGARRTDLGQLRQGMRAALALGDLKESGLEALRALVEQGDLWTSITISVTLSEALRQIGEPALPILRAAARDPRSHVRSRALSVLWRWWDDTLTEQCLSDLHDADPKLRCAAAKALEWHAKALPAAANEPLIAALDDADLWVRYHAARALRVVGDERAIQPLLGCRSNAIGKMPASDLKRDCMTAVIAIFHRSRETRRRAETN